jgi:hypothetical protein
MNDGLFIFAGQVWSLFSLANNIEFGALGMETQPLEHIAPLAEHCHNSKIQLFSREVKPLAGVMQSNQENDTSPLSRPFLKTDVTLLH